MPNKQASKNSPQPPQTNELIGRFDALCVALTQHRKRPLLVMFYPPGASMLEFDLRDVYSEFRSGGCDKEKPVPQLDLLLHTSGGDPIAGYRIAQTIRSVCSDLTVLVPEYAYSAGTLLSFAGDEIRLGDFAGLSPIDITVRGKQANDSEGIQLAAVDSFLDFAQKAREKTEKLLDRLGRNTSASCIDSDLLVQMVKEVGALTVGRYYRERAVTGHYAQVLLDSYMFKTESDKESRRSAVIQHFLFGAPAHEFHLDYRLCDAWYLKVSQMPTSESDLCKAVVNQLRICANKGIICDRINHDIRMPLITFIPYAEKTSRRKANASIPKKTHPAKRGAGNPKKT
jgi:hypothetical protein